MISLILPVYNCFPETMHTIPMLVDRLAHLGIPFEIILVDDHSKNPGKYQELAAAHHCIYLRNDRNFGKGFSVRKGFANAAGTVLIFMDGDFPFELEVIDRMIQTFRDEKIDIVIGDRSLEMSTFPDGTTPLRNTGSHILSLITKRCITRGFSDTQCGIKGFRKTAADHIFPYTVVDGFSFDLEILFIAIRKKYVISKIPVKAIKQSSSNVRVIYHGIETLVNIVRIFIRKWRGLYPV
jgi:dolichyl-phosphate beta-glucosyltransferase